MAHLEKAAAVLELAVDADDPALVVYKNDLRTPLFMLQGLARIYSHTFSEKKFDALKNDYKLIEDALGAVDYYDSFAEQSAKINELKK